MKVSIIIPVYNAEKYLYKCIESIVNQRYRDFELILINDGSTDRSGLICDEFKDKYSNIVVRHKENGGSASARNLGLAIAKGEYIAFVDADDHIANNFLERLVELAVEYNADLVQCGFEIIRQSSSKVHNEYEKQNKVIKRVNNIQMLEDFCSKQNYLRSVVLWNKLIRREIFNGLRFEEGKGVDDEYLIYKILHKSSNNILTDEVLYFYVMSDGSQMRSGYSLKNLDSIDVIEQQLDFFEKIDNKKLHNMLLYRYYSSILFNYYYIKKYYKNEYDTLNKLKTKRKKLFKALLIKEIGYKDKINLLIKYYLPISYELIRIKRGQ